MRITKETQLALGGSSRATTAESLLQGEAYTYLYQYMVNDVAVDISDYTFDFQLIERSAAYIKDTKEGLSITGLATKEGATPIDLSDQVTVTDAVNGFFQIHIPTSLTATEPSDPDSTMPILYTGYLSINDGGTPSPNIYKSQWLLTVSNDGVSV